MQSRDSKRVFLGQGDVSLGRRDVSLNRRTLCLSGAKMTFPKELSNTSSQRSRNFPEPSGLKFHPTSYPKNHKFFRIRFSLEPANQKYCWSVVIIIHLKIFVCKVVQRVKESQSCIELLPRYCNAPGKRLQQK